MNFIINLIITIFFYPLLILYSFFFSISAIILSTIGFHKTASYLIKLWGKLVFRASFSSIEIIGTEKISSNTSYLFCPNHSSAFDIYLLTGYLPRNFSWISKPAYFKIPFIGTVMKCMGFVSMNRTNPKKSLKNVNKAIDRILKKKLSMAIFPEGTRSRDGNLQKFKRGSLIIAVQSNTPIVPITIIGTYNIQPKNKIFIKRSKVKIIISEPVLPPGNDKESQLKILNKIHTTIENNLLKENM